MFFHNFSRGLQTLCIHIVITQKCLLYSDLFSPHHKSAKSLFELPSFNGLTAFENFQKLSQFFPVCIAIFLKKFWIFTLRKCCKIRPFSNFQTLWTLASHSSSLKGHFSRGPASPCDLQNNEFPSQNSRQHLWESIMYRVILRRFEFCHKNRIRGAKTFVHIILLRLVSQIF